MLMFAIPLFTLVALFISFLFDRKKTYNAILKGMKMLWGIFPDLILILLLASVLLGVISQEIIVRFLGQGSGLWAMTMASIIGSIALIPGFVAFPLAAFLKDAGVSLDILAVFLTTLMMVGIVTFPVEMKFFGFRATALRNFFSFIGAIIIGILVGAFV